MKNLTTKIKTVSIYIIGANGESYLYHENNEYKMNDLPTIIKCFKLQPLHFATELEGLEFGEPFNTYNWGAPVTFCGVHEKDDPYGKGLVNIHLGGDARGNYSEPYFCEEMYAILCQDTILDVELTNGDIYSITCDNGEGYFNLDHLDPYWVDLDEPVSKDLINELESLNEV